MIEKSALCLEHLYEFLVLSIKLLHSVNALNISLEISAEIKGATTRQEGDEFEELMAVMLDDSCREGLDIACEHVAVHPTRDKL